MKNLIRIAYLIIALLISLFNPHQSAHGESNMDADTIFKAERISRSDVIVLNATLDRVFPLFGPMEEKNGPMDGIRKLFSQTRIKTGRKPSIISCRQEKP
jgi:hypothetical protein